MPLRQKAQLNGESTDYTSPETLNGATQHSEKEIRLAAGAANHYDSETSVRVIVRHSELSPPQAWRE